MNETIFYIKYTSNRIYQTDKYSYEDISRHDSGRMAYIIEGIPYLKYNVFNTYDEAKEKIETRILNEIKILENKIYHLKETIEEL